jgi:hypothetical protein
MAKGHTKEEDRKFNFDLIFKLKHLPQIQAEFEKNGKPNVKARKKGYQKFLENCHKFNMINNDQLKSWKLPKKLEALIVIIG